MIQGITTADSFIEISKLELKIPDFRFGDAEGLDENPKLFKINKKYIELNIEEINSNNFKDICLFSLILDLSQIVHNQYDSQYPFGITVRCLPSIRIVWEDIIKDAEILLPDLNNLNKNDIDVIKEFIMLYIDRAKYIIRENISHSKIKTEDSVVIGISEQDKSEYMKEQMNEITDIYEQKIKDENILFTDADSSEKEFMIEIMDLDDENEDEDVSDKKCESCGSDNIIYVGMNNYYCYDCEATWS